MTNNKTGSSQVVYLQYIPAEDRGRLNDGIPEWAAKNKILL
jgi:hypothetical protein